MPSEESVQCGTPFYKLSLWVFKASGAIEYKSTKGYRIQKCLFCMCCARWRHSGQLFLGLSMFWIVPVCLPIRTRNVIILDESLRYWPSCLILKKKLPWILLCDCCTIEESRLRAEKQIWGNWMFEHNIWLEVTGKMKCVVRCSAMQGYKDLEVSEVVRRHCWSSGVSDGVLQGPVSWWAGVRITQN